MGLDMTFTELKFLVRSDLHRYAGTTSLPIFLHHYVRTPGFRYSFYMRLCAFLAKRPLLRYGVRHLCLLKLNRLGVRFGISIPYTTSVGPGLYIGHHGGIVVNDEAVIGRNCNLSHDVTIGQSNRGARRGCPQIGDNVYIAPGSRLIGRITVGDHAAIGANAVVTRDVPAHAVVAGIPAEVISMEGSAGYVNRTDYR